MALPDPDSATAGFLLRTVQAIIVAAIAGWAGAAPSTGVPEFEFDIEAGSVVSELRQFYSVTGSSILYDARLNTEGQGVRGRYTAEEALTRILRDTGLSCIHVSEGHGIVVRPSSNTDHGPKGRCLYPAHRRSQSEAGPTPQTPIADQLLTVAITGTHIHHELPVGSALLVWNEEQIRRSGAHELSDLLADMTQNFAGGPNQHTHFGQAETYTNSGLGTAANLRGVGARATLVLLNGHRIAPSGSAAAFVDILNIPLSVVKEVEVMLDGASAIYGSDAVGGVINIHTKDEYVRPETFAELGSVTNGRQEQHRVSQDLGTRWEGGDLILVGEEMHRGALAANERWQNSSDLSALSANPQELYATPGNLRVAGQTFPIPSGQVGRLDFATLAPGVSNRQDRYTDSDIVPDQLRRSLYTAFRQGVGSSGTVFGDILWTQRRAVERQGGELVSLNVTNSPFLLNPPPTPVIEYINLLGDVGTQVTAVNVRTLNATLGGQIDLPNQWHVMLTGSDVLESESQVALGQVEPFLLQAAVSNPDPALAFDPFGADSQTAASVLGVMPTRRWFGSRSQLWDFAAVADGPFLALPTGPLHGALGIEYRDQRFSTVTSQTPTASDLRRQLYAGFAELVVPVLNATAHPSPLGTLTLSLAGRVEEDSDFGEAATPRMGVNWEPMTQLAVRAAWSTSIRAPNLGDLVEKNNFSYVAPVSGTQALVWSGGNAGLQVERAQTRTVGLSFKSDESRRFTADLGYFDILYRNRIQPGELTADVLTNPAYASFVIHNPSASERAAVCNESQFFGAGICLRAPIQAIVDLRERNTATLWTDGIDASFGSHFETPIGKWGLSLAGTYILHYKEADTPNEPLVSLLNTLSNPLVLHAIATTSWKIGNVESSLDVRYSSPYRNLQTQPATRVASWTTVGLGVAYTFNTAERRPSRPVEIALQGENLLNRYSPFAVNTVANLGYDQENGDLAGRVVTLGVDVKW
jgi:iron complex outermembrane receptor protein